MIKVYQTNNELTNLKTELAKVKDVPGDLVEVGVFEGGSAKIIAEAYPERKVLLFDTFEGFPDKLSSSSGDSLNYFVGDCLAELHTAKEYLKDNKNIQIFKGVFPECATLKQNLCFAHIDVDIYQSTKDSLEYLYPKMNKGGVVLVHDYPVHPGVKKAVDDFLSDKKLETRQYGEAEGLPRQLAIQV